MCMICKYFFSSKKHILLMNHYIWYTYILLMNHYIWYVMIYISYTCTINAPLLCLWYVCMIHIYVMIYRRPPLFFLKRPFIAPIVCMTCVYDTYICNDLHIIQHTLFISYNIQYSYHTTYTIHHTRVLLMRPYCVYDMCVWYIYM